MFKKDNINYTRISSAIDFIRKNFKDQPTLDDIDQYYTSKSFYTLLTSFY